MYRASTLVDRTKAEKVAEWAELELYKIQREFSLQDFIFLALHNVAPTKPREGMIAFADGTNWNPGGGKGIYGYYNGTWNKF